jgi:hypothetical protein
MAIPVITVDDEVVVGHPKRVGEVNWADQQNRPTFDPVVENPPSNPPIPMPPLPGQTHSWGLVDPKPGRRVEMSS